MNKIKSKDKRKSNKKINFLRILLVFLIICWTFMVFNFSNQSGTESSDVSQSVTRLFTKQEELIEMIEPYARKIAHFGEYSIGGILFVLLFYTYNWSNKRRITTAMVLGVWYAITDEIHQLMIPERNGSIIDVWIDSLGVATGIVFILIIIKILNNMKNRRRVNK